jgi:hypothetical protein
MSITTASIQEFLHAQLACWNAGDKEGFFNTYRKIAPAGLAIEYVGRPLADGWTVLEGMWAQQNARIEIEEITTIVNGNEAACYNRNKVKETGMAIDTIEVYRFTSEGKLEVRYFICQP